MILESVVLATMAGALGVESSRGEGRVDSSRGDGSRRKQLPGTATPLAYRIWKRIWEHNSGAGRGIGQSELSSWSYWTLTDKHKEIVDRLLKTGLAVGYAEVGNLQYESGINTVLEMSDGSFLVFASSYGFHTSVCTPDEHGLAYTGEQKSPDPHARGRHYNVSSWTFREIPVSPKYGDDLAGWALNKNLETAAIWEVRTKRPHTLIRHISSVVSGEKP